MFSRSDSDLRASVSVPSPYELREKVASATRWSLVTEIVVKLISPVSQVALAHILAPEAFGVVATVTMVTSFADMLSDAGFQKYLVQHELSTTEELSETASVAFWTNLSVSVVLWTLVAVFCEPLAALVGNPGLGSVLFVACATLPLTALSSIQLAIYHRCFDFKGLFVVRVITAFVPLVISLPLAVMGLGYWSLIIGTIVGNTLNAAVLTIRSTWRPRFYYSLDTLWKMFSFSAWTLLEQLSIWLTSWSGTFVIGSILSPYYLGLYKTSISMVNSAFSVVTGATTPVLFATLSRLQADNERFKKAFYDMQRRVALFIMPLGVGVFVFRDFATEILLGSQWAEASLMLGSWALSGSVVTMLSHYASEAYRAKGWPRLSFCCQLLYLFLLLPVTYWAASQGFQVFAAASSIVRMLGILISLFALNVFVGMRTGELIGNVAPVFTSSVVMGIVGELLRRVSSEALPTIGWILLCALVYAGLCCFFPSTRREIISVLSFARTPFGKSLTERKSNPANRT